MDDIVSLAGEINPDELPEPYKLLAYKIGVRPTLILASLYQGTGLYLPKLDGYLHKIRNDKIKQEFNGYNYKELAIKYRLTEKWVRDIVSKDSNQIDNQISIFDFKDLNESG